MPSQLHHVVMRSHSASTFIQFLTDVVGMEIQSQFRVPGEVLETTLGWPPSEGADVTMLGSGDAGLIEVLDVPDHLRDAAPEGLAALSFLTTDYNDVQDKARTMASDVTVLFGDVPGVDLILLHDGWRSRGVHGRLRHRQHSGGRDNWRQPVSLPASFGRVHDG